MKTSVQQTINLFGTVTVVARIPDGKTRTGKG